MKSPGRTLTGSDDGGGSSSAATTGAGRAGGGSCLRSLAALAATTSLQVVRAGATIEAADEATGAGRFGDDHGKLYNVSQAAIQCRRWRRRSNGATGRRAGSRRVTVGWALPA